MTSTNLSRREKQRKSKGTVQTKVSNGRLQLVFSWQGQRYYLSVGLPDTPLNRKGADRIARQIELDFVSGNFDPSLDKGSAAKKDTGRKEQRAQPAALFRVLYFLASP